MKAFLRKYRLDVVLVSVLLLASVISSLILFASGKKGALRATVYHHDEIVLTVDLSTENGLTQYTVQGDHGEMVLETKKNAVHILSSTCPHKDCVDMGWVSSTERPIICAYNAVSIILSSSSGGDDVEV